MGLFSNLLLRRHTIQVTEDFHITATVFSLHLPGNMT